MKDFFKEAYARLNSQTPSFFKKIGTIGASFAGTGGALLVSEVAGAHIPEAVTKIGAHMLTAGAIMKAVAHFACTDPPSNNSQQNP
jgi:hypothetical protein